MAVEIFLIDTTEIEYAQVTLQNLMNKFLRNVKNVSDGTLVILKYYVSKVNVGYWFRMIRYW